MMPCESGNLGLGQHTQQRAAGRPGRHPSIERLDPTVLPQIHGAGALVDGEQHHTGIDIVGQAGKRGTVGTKLQAGCEDRQYRGPSSIRDSLPHLFGRQPDTAEVVAGRGPQAFDAAGYANDARAIRPDL
jgi:hypothetical protein